MPTRTSVDIAPETVARLRKAHDNIVGVVADGIEARAGQIAAMETLDTGLPVTQAKGQAARAAENFRYFANVIVAQHEAAFSQPGQLGYVLRVPAGVAGLITPWNTPFMLESWKIAPALASGCTGRAQARRVDPAVGLAAAGDHDRGGRARRRLQHRPRHRRRSRRRLVAHP
ncbi:MAG: aldehyde dehydrogenase family protein [Trebonia sp.]